MAYFSEIIKKPLQAESVTYPIAGAAIPKVFKSSTIKIRPIDGSMYLHHFRSKSTEIPCRNILYTYQVKVTTDSDCTLTAYVSTCQVKMHVGSDIKNRPIVVDVIAGRTKTFVLNFKRLSIVTDAVCKLKIKVTPIRYIDSYLDINYTLTNNRDGHLLVTLPRSNHNHVLPRVPMYRICSEYKSIPHKSQYDNIKYTISLASALTITDLVDSLSKFPPYSIKLPQVSGITCTLNYRIVIKASEEDNAQVDVTCIEGLSGNRYCILKDVKGENICNTHTGQVLEGTFILYPLPIDVGLHIYTPYGFSGDLSNDMKEDLVKIEKFELSYQSF
jgi:hypothetical protein